MSKNIDWGKVESGAKHFGDAVGSLLTGIAHFVQAAAPVAEVVGAAVGQPEVVAAAKLASLAAGAEIAAADAKAAGEAGHE